MDAAQRLGDILLARDKLLPSEVQTAIVTARDERAVEDRRTRIRTLTTRISLAGRLSGRIEHEALWLAGIAKLAQEILEVTK